MMQERGMQDKGEWKKARDRKWEWRTQLPTVKNAIHQSSLLSEGDKKELLKAWSLIEDAQSSIDEIIASIPPFRMDNLQNHYDRANQWGRLMFNQYKLDHRTEKLLNTAWSRQVVDPSHLRELRLPFPRQVDANKMKRGDLRLVPQNVAKAIIQEGGVDDDVLRDLLSYHAEGFPGTDIATFFVSKYWPTETEEWREWSPRDRQLIVTHDLARIINDLAAAYSPPEKLAQKVLNLASKKRRRPPAKVTLPVTEVDEDYSVYYFDFLAKAFEQATKPKQADSFATFLACRAYAKDFFANPPKYGLDFLPNMWLHEELGRVLAWDPSGKGVEAPLLIHPQGKASRSKVKEKILITRDELMKRLKDLNFPYEFAAAIETGGHLPLCYFLNAFGSKTPAPELEVDRLDEKMSNLLRDETFVKSFNHWRAVARKENIAARKKK